MLQVSPVVVIYNICQECMNRPGIDNDTMLKGHFAILMHQIDADTYIAATNLIEMRIVNVKLSILKFLHLSFFIFHPSSINQHVTSVSCICSL